MHRELVIPNLHVILVHYPLGLFFVGLLLELGSFMWRKHPARTAGRWMILLGGLSMVPTALSGVYALHDVAVAGITTPPTTWADTMAASPLTADQWGQLFWHTWLMSIATALVVGTIVVYLGLSDNLRRRLYLLAMGLLLVGAGMMGSGAWFAGEAIYRFGIGVGKPSVAAATTEPTTQASASVASTIAKINIAVPPLQPHVIFAGVAIAVALAAVGLSFRAITREVPPPRMDVAESLMHSLTPVEPLAPIPAGRFWLLASGVFILTALGGWYVFGSDAGTFVPKDMWQMATDSAYNGGQWLTRGMGHVIAAGGLVLLPLILAIIAKWAPRQKLLLTAFTGLLMLAIAAQLWLGILLLFDGPAGKLTRFN